MNSNEDENLDLIDVEMAMDLIDEVWLPIIGYEGKYEISNYGRVKNVKRNRCLTLRASGTRLRCSLVRNDSNKSVDFYVSTEMPKYFPDVDYLGTDLCAKLNSLNNPVDYLDDLNGEQWCDITRYENIFQVSTKGRVKSLSRQVPYTRPDGSTAYRNLPDRILRQNTNDHMGNYMQVILAVGSVNKPYLVHRLVAQAFIPNPDNLPQVNHIDGDKANNNIENLEWMTAQENMAHAHKNGLMAPPKGPEHHKAIFSWEDVRGIRELHRKTGMLHKDIAKMYGVSGTTISDIVNYRKYKHDPMEETK